MKLIQAFLTENPCYRANLDRADERYRVFQDRGPVGLMLHSVGCAQPSAEVFVRRWNRPDYDRACVHAFIDANTGDVWQTLPWSFRGWHGGGSCNNTHIGVELCEPDCLSYTGGVSFTVWDRDRAVACAARTREAAAELFSTLCKQYGLEPETAILSHREGGRRGIATAHADPEHLWTGLGLDWTMDGFRAMVRAKMDAKNPDPSPERAPLYRVQIGAFHNRAYAEAMLTEARKTFPNAFLKKE